MEKMRDVEEMVCEVEIDEGMESRVMMAWYRGSVEWGEGGMGRN